LAGGLTSYTVLLILIGAITLREKSVQNIGRTEIIAAKLAAINVMLWIEK